MELSDLFHITPLQSPVSLYFHIPFCGKKCGYCDFYSVPIENELNTNYIDTIIAQLRFFLKRLESHEIPTVYIGGGTPNCLHSDDLEKLMTKLTSVIGEAVKEWTIELNPEYITYKQIELIKHYPVSRISIGVQSFNDRLLSVLERQSSGIQIENALEIVKKHWKGDVSIDLMCYVPGQREAELINDIDAALRFSPDHFSLYTLTLEKDTPLNSSVKEGIVRPNPSDYDYKVWQSGIAYLESMGFRRYEISNFSTPGKQCRHNVRYWKMESYIGCGAGAVSTIRSGDAVIRIETIRDTDAYVRRPTDMGMKIDTIGKKDFLLEYIMMGFRLSEGIEKAEFEKVFNVTFNSIFLNDLHRWKEQNLVIDTSENVYCTSRGWDLLNIILVDAACTIDNLVLTRHSNSK